MSRCRHEIRSRAVGPDAGRPQQVRADVQAGPRAEAADAPPAPTDRPPRHDHPSVAGRLLLLLLRHDRLLHPLRYTHQGRDPESLPVLLHLLPRLLPRAPPSPSPSSEHLSAHLPAVHPLPPPR